MPDTWFIGCDMGGWHTTEGDALAACRWDGTALHHVTAVAGSLFYPVGADLQAVIAQALQARARVVVGIDAALAWPVKFLALATQAPAATHLPIFNRALGQYANPYLFRATERYVQQVLGQNPLTAPGDKFGNNSSKAQALVAWFQQSLPGLYRPPFQPWNAQMASAAPHTLIEVYPAASMRCPAFGQVGWPPPPVPTPMHALGNGDIADAKRAAMTAACYAATAGIPAPVLPHTCVPANLPAGYALNEIATEGWIFAPV